MPYTPTTYTTGGTATAANLNNGETQYSEATQSLEQDLFTGFVFSGFTAARDGTTLSQLDVAAGVALIKQTDNTLRRRALTSSTQSTVGHASATMFLDLNPDGTWSFATTHSAQANYLTIATVTTDASANIATVTDTRVTATTLLSGMAGQLTLPTLASLDVAGNATIGAGKSVALANTASGGGITGKFQLTDPDLSGAYFDLNGDNVRLVVAYQGGASSEAWHTSTQDKSVTFQGRTNIGTVRNGTVTAVPIFTGTSTPASPPTGSIWIKA